MSTAEKTIIWLGAERLREHLIPISELRHHQHNRRRGDKQAIAMSLKRFGQVRAIVVTDEPESDGKRTIVAGHHVTMAAELLGWTHIAAIPAAFANRNETRAYLEADNNLAQIDLSDAEPATQVTIMEELLAHGGLEGTGFTMEELEDARKLSELKSERMEIDKLKSHEKNYKSHSAAQLAHLTQSLKDHGFYRNVVVAKDGTVLAGHGILEAAREVGLKRVPVTRLNLAPDDPKALSILAGDNELGKLAEVDDRTLTELLKKVRDEGDVQMLLGTGYDAETLAALVLVTRPESEITNHNAAAEWIGLPGFERADDRISLVLSFDNEEDRAKLVEQLGLVISQSKRKTSSAWWPPRERQDLSSLWFGGEAPADGTVTIGTATEPDAEPDAEPDDAEDAA